MSHSSQSGKSPNNRSLIRRSSHERSQRVSRKNSAGSEVGQVKSDKPAFKRSARKQHAEMITYQPTSEELHRIERMMALQERMANIDKIRVQGHTYGKLAISGNARAIRGNLLEKSTSSSFSRSHTYGDCEVGDGAMVWNGDVTLETLQDSRKHSKSSHVGKDEGDCHV